MPYPSGPYPRATQQRNGTCGRCRELHEGTQGGGVPGPGDLTATRGRASSSGGRSENPLGSAMLAPWPPAVLGRGSSEGGGRGPSTPWAVHTAGRPHRRTSVHTAGRPHCGPSIHTAGCPSTPPSRRLGAPGVCPASPVSVLRSLRLPFACGWGPRLRRKTVKYTFKVKSNFHQQTGGRACLPVFLLEFDGKQRN